MAREIFCPLVNGECKYNCIFNNYYRYSNVLSNYAWNGYGTIKSFI